MTLNDINISNIDCIEALKYLEDESIDCIITDPPYGIEYYSGYYKGINPHSPIINDDKFFFPIDELWRVLKPTGCIFCFFSHKVPLVDSRVRNVIIWVKNNWSAGDLEGDFGNQYECIAFMPKPDFVLKSKRFSNVWEFDRLPADRLKHPTQKPEPLIRRLIESATQEGDIVLDPFLGSGTTAVCCKQLKRKCVGMEIDEKHYRTCQERLQQEILIT